MSINLGSKSISKIYLGSKEIVKVYLGSKEIHDSTPVITSFPAPTLQVSRSFPSSSAFFSLRIAYTLPDGYSFARIGGGIISVPQYVFAYDADPTRESSAFTGDPSSQSNSGRTEIRIAARIVRTDSSNFGHDYFITEIASINVRNI